MDKYKTWKAKKDLQAGIELVRSESWSRNKNEDANATVLLTRAAKGYERLYGMQHDDTRDCWYWLGRAFYRCAMHHEAKGLLQQCMAGEVTNLNALPKPGDRMLTSQYWLGRALIGTEELPQAAEQLQEAMAKQERILGKDHKYTIGTGRWLGYVFYIQQEYGKAEEVLARFGDEPFKKTFRLRDDSVDSRVWLALSFFGQGKYREAETLFQELLGTWMGPEFEWKLPADSPRNLFLNRSKPTPNNMLHVVGMHEPYFEDKHLVFLCLNYWIGREFYARGAYDKAAERFRFISRKWNTEDIECQESLPQSPNVKDWLGYSLFNCVRLSQAAREFQGAAEQNRRRLGERHRATLGSQVWVGLTLFNDKKYEDALQQLQPTFEVQTEEFGIYDHDVLRSELYIGQCLQALKRLPEAEEVFRVNCTKWEKVGADHSEARWSLASFGQVQREQERRVRQEQKKMVRQEQEKIARQQQEALREEEFKEQQEKIARQQQEKIARQQQEEIARQQQEEIARQQQEEIARQQQEEIARQQQEEIARQQQEEIAQEIRRDHEKMVQQQEEKEFEQKMEKYFGSLPQRRIGSGLQEKREEGFRQESKIPVENNPGVRSREHSESHSVGTVPNLLRVQLNQYFANEQSRREKYADHDIHEITTLLTMTNPEWSKLPRTYIILRHIGRLNFLNILIDIGFSDYWLPVTERSLPRCLPPDIRTEFVDAQNLVLTASMDLEKGERGKHCHFTPSDTLPFKSIRYLGSGGFGEVDEVSSLISLKTYARKRVLRTTLFKGRRSEYTHQFIAEIEILKRLNHRHIVKFVGSYTDPKYVGLIMLPVAEMDLAAYLTSDTAPKIELRTFFGCLASGLSFLHQEKIRHKDIKPGNILITSGGQNVLFADFGLSFDFTDATGSTTIGMCNGLSRRYCAPEVAMEEPRNTMSDIWSLGVVFMEMIVVLLGLDFHYMTEFLTQHGSGESCIRTNYNGFLELVSELKELDKAEMEDNAPLLWTHKMLSVAKQMRPTASALVRTIRASGPGAGVSFCGACCLPSDDEFSDHGRE